MPVCGEPISVIVLLVLPFGPKAPLLRCSQLSAAWTQAGPMATPFSQHFCAGLPKAPVASRSRQYPENTRLWTLTVPPVSLVANVPVHVSVPLVRLNAIGSVPMLNIGSGGQSWLVG